MFVNRYKNIKLVAHKVTRLIEVTLPVNMILKTVARSDNIPKFDSHRTIIINSNVGTAPSVSFLTKPQIDIELG